MLSVAKSNDITIEGLNFQFSTDTDAMGIQLYNNMGITIQRCLFTTRPAGGTTSTPSVARLVSRSNADTNDSTAIGLSGFTLAAIIRENVFLTGIGIRNMSMGTQFGSSAEESRELLAAMIIRDNLFKCMQSAVALLREVVFVGATAIQGNSIYGCNVAGIQIDGSVASNSRGISTDFVALTNGSPLATHIEVVANTLSVQGIGIFARCDQLSIRTNTLVWHPTEGATPDGIRVSLVKDAYTQIVDNSISGFPGYGVNVSADSGSLLIRGNHIQQIGTGGINAAGADHLQIGGNSISDIGWNPGTSAATVAIAATGITTQLQVAKNTIARIGKKAMRAVGMEFINCDALTSISRNEITDIGSTIEGMGAGIIVISNPSVPDLTISDNVVRQGSAVAEATSKVNWCALVIGNNFSSSGSVPKSVGMINEVTDANPVLIRGNHFETDSNFTLVEILLFGPCLFSDNRCQQHSGFVNSTINIFAGEIIFSSNHVRVGVKQLPPTSAAVVTLKTSGELHLAAVFGNLVNGGIKVDGPFIVQNKPYLGQP
jgi:hypothetical protein